MHAFDQLLDSYRALADSERAKGNYLEQRVKQFLLNDGVQAPQYRDVWLWMNRPATVRVCSASKTRSRPVITSRVFSYKPLWKILINKDLNKTQLQDLAGRSPATVAKLDKGENVTLEASVRIREVLDCDISEIVTAGPSTKITPTNEEDAHVATH